MTRFYTDEQRKADKNKFKAAKLEEYKKQCIDRCNSMNIKEGYISDYLVKRETPLSQQAQRRKSSKGGKRRARRTKKFFGLF